MDWMVRAALTALTVGTVLLVAERFGQLVGGFCAALPTVTAPALGWIAHDRGVVFASQAAVAGVASCAMLAAFAFAYVRAPRRGGSGLAMACGAAAAAAMAVPVWYASQDLMHALALSTATWFFTLLTMPREAIVIVHDRLRRGPRAVVPIAAAAALLSATAAMAGDALGTFAAGLLSSLPFISGVVTVVEHSTHGPAAAATFLRGYVDGLPGKAAFGALFACFAVPAGSALAMTLAFGGLLALSLATAWLVRPPASSARRRPVATDRPERCPDRHVVGCDEAKREPEPAAAFDRPSPAREYLACAEGRHSYLRGRRTA